MRHMRIKILHIVDICSFLDGVNISIRLLDTQLHTKRRLGSGHELLKSDMGLPKNRLPLNPLPSHALCEAGKDWD